MSLTITSPPAPETVVRPRPRLIVATATVWAAFAAVLFVGTGRFSLAAVERACGLPAPDVRTAPSPEEVRSFVAACGPHGLAAWRDVQLVDLLYPAATAAFLVTVLMLLARRLPRRVTWVLVLPLLAAAADYVENAGAWVLLTRGVDATSWAESLVQLGSALKVAASWASWTCVVALTVWVALRTARGRARQLRLDRDPVPRAGDDPR